MFKKNKAFVDTCSAWIGHGFTWYRMFIQCIADLNKTLAPYAIPICPMDERAEMNMRSIEPTAQIKVDWWPLSNDY